MSDDETSDREAQPRARMSKDANRLTAKKIEKLKKPGRYHDGHGLLLQVSPSGSKSWLLRYQRDGREHMHGLGPLHTVTLKEARERAKGGSPPAARRQRSGRGPSREAYAGQASSRYRDHVQAGSRTLPRCTRERLDGCDPPAAMATIAKRLRLSRNR
ncbi:MAG: Arm DNA-binding domain-containing protein [Xanthobacteraceae bacterium]